jgi:hypothetical protein
LLLTTLPHPHRSHPNSLSTLGCYFLEPQPALEMTANMETSASLSGVLPHLPDEILINILSHNLAHDRDICKDTHSIMFQEEMSPIIATRNRRLVKLALDVYYRYNTFVIGVSQHTYSLHYYQTTYSSYMCRPNALKAPLIRNLRVELYKCGLGYDAEDILIQPNAAWAWLLRSSVEYFDHVKRYKHLLPANEPFSHDLGWKTKWQSDFTGLRKLKIVIHFRPDVDMPFGPRGFHEAFRFRSYGAVARYKECIESSSIQLKALEVEAVVNMFELEVGESEAYRVLERLLKEMMQSKE